MPGYPLPAVREEVRNYLRTCEYLIAAAYSSPLTVDELQMVNYYVDEVGKMVGQRAAVKLNPKEVSLHNGNGTASASEAH